MNQFILFFQITALSIEYLVGGLLFIAVCNIYFFHVSFTQKHSLDSDEMLSVTDLIGVLQNPVDENDNPINWEKAPSFSRETLLVLKQWNNATSVANNMLIIGIVRFYLF